MTSLIESPMSGSAGIMSPDLETLRIRALEYLKILGRIRRHGDNIVHKRGRKPTTEEQKKERRRKYEEKKRQIKIENGTYVPRGRPRLVPQEK